MRIRSGRQTQSTFCRWRAPILSCAAALPVQSGARRDGIAGLPIQTEDKESCEFRLENGFLGIYAPDAGQRFGFNHFCFGIEKYDPQTAVDTIRRAMPEAKPSLENQGQVYVQDPDGVRVQFADVNYKR